MAARPVAVALLGLGAWAAGATARLEYTPITSPETIVAGPGATAAGPSGKLILPPGSVRIKSDSTADIAIGSDTIKMGWKGGPEFSVTAGGKTQALRPIVKGYGLQPATLALSGGKRYLMAFPVARLNSTAEGLLAIVWYRSGSAQTTTIDGELVWFYDANTDGAFDAQNDMMRVGQSGKGPVFAPIASHFATSKGIYHIEELSADGKTLKYSAYSGPAGKLRVLYDSSNTEASLVLLSSESKMNTAITASNKVRPDANLIAGEYRAQFGVVTLNGQGTVAAVIDPATLAPVKIAAGQTANYVIGGPLRLDFAATREGGKFKVDPASFKIVGKAGEQYLQTNWTQQPEVSVLAGGASKTSGKMEFGEGGGLTEYSGALPMGDGQVKVIIMGTLGGLGAIRGEAVAE